MVGIYVGIFAGALVGAGAGAADNFGTFTSTFSPDPKITDFPLVDT